MASFGDALRGLGSVLSPQVAQEVAADDRAQQQHENQLGTLAVQQRIQQASPQYQAQVEALNNEKQFRLEATEANGDQAKIASAAVKYGKPELAISLYKNQEDRAARVQQAHDSLEARRQELELKLSDKTLDRDMKERLNTMLTDMKSQQLALTGEIAKGNQELKRMQFSMKADQGLQKNVQQLGGALEKAGLPEADAVLGAADDAIKANPNLADYISGDKAWVPDIVAGKEVAAGRQAFQKLFNITLKQRSGSAVTNQELERLKSEFAAGTFKNKGQLQAALDQARGVLNKHYTSIAGGFGPEALDAYNENIRGLGGKVVLERPKTSGWSVQEVQ